MIKTMHYIMNNNLAVIMQRWKIGNLITFVARNIINNDTDYYEYLLMSFIADFRIMISKILINKLKWWQLLSELYIIYILWVAFVEILKKLFDLFEGFDSKIGKYI